MPHATRGVEPIFQVVTSSGALAGRIFEPRSPMAYVVPFAVTVWNTESPPTGVCLYLPPACPQGSTTAAVHSAQGQIHAPQQGDTAQARK
jgi:hypothetical protein